MSHIVTISRPPEQWVVICLIYFCTMIANSLILAYELQKRISKQATFTTNTLKILSLLTIISAVIIDFCRFVQYFNGFCYFAWQITTAFSIQLSFMGLYQISRLYYSFAQSQVHTNKGYPNWLINIMYIIGILLIFNTQCLGWICVQAPLFCGINKKYQYIAKYDAQQFLLVSTHWFSISKISACLWDFTTLLLYIIKVTSFRKYKSKQVIVYNRIMSILNRILTLTVFYEIPYFFYILAGVLYLINVENIAGLWRILFAIAAALSSITMNYSMLLMQQHNTVQYKNFLKLSYEIGVYNICCFFRSFVRNEVYSQERESNVNENQKHNNDSNDINYKHEDTIFDTDEIASVKMEHSMMKQISFDTTMQPAEININV
eukprot:60275_1